MIPKTIHYCWFGKNPKNKLIQKCIASWEKYLPDYEIIEWNEENFDIERHPFTKKAYKAGHWAFVADYVRLWVLEKYGGVYLDTDMEIIQSITPLLDNPFFIGKENEKYISAGIIGSLRKEGGEKIFFDEKNIDYRKNIIKNQCNNCIHDYHGQAEIKNVFIFLKYMFFERYAMTIYKLKTRWMF